MAYILVSVLQHLGRSESNLFFSGGGDIVQVKHLSVSSRLGGRQTVLGSEVKRSSLSVFEYQGLVHQHGGMIL